jgi:hypothetical protein
MSEPLPVRARILRIRVYGYRDSDSSQQTFQQIRLRFSVSSVESQIRSAGAVCLGALRAAAAMRVLLLLVQFVAGAAAGASSPPPPPPGATAPENALLWPKPQQHSIEDAIGLCSASTFSFTISTAAAAAAAAAADAADGDGDDHATSNGQRHESFMQQAFDRYRAIVFPSVSPLPPRLAGSLPALSALNVLIRSSDLTLALETSENYTLAINFPNATLHADTVFGALRGLETFSQMVQPDLSIRKQTVRDWPRFPFRAVLVDTGRHYLPVPLLRAHIDAMSYNKMNVLHWHIVDMPSFPFVSRSFPALSGEGAFDQKHVYNPSDIAGLVNYAKMRGVMIVPEFDSPGHTFPSWGRGGPADLLTSCPSASTGNTGPLRADRNQTYEFLSTLFGEVATAFPDRTFHGGGECHACHVLSAMAIR